MRRREVLGWIGVAGSAAALPRSGLAAAPQTLRYGAPTGVVIPADFTGLSYERAQLSNPGYFSPDNRALVSLFRELSPTGSLRLGGSSGEHTAYIGDEARPAPFEIFGPEHNKTFKEGMFVSSASLRSLRGFLDATGWRCLYGLPLAHGTPQEMAREAADVARILGPRLSAFQIGNEPDAFRNRFRPAALGPQDYLGEWDRAHAAIAAAAPGVAFAGPDISNKLDYITAFAAAAPRYRDVVMLTGHYYAMGPAASPEATLDQLFVREATTTTFKQVGYGIVADAVRTARLPYRMAEGNSCWDGGKAGVSDVHAAAIWGADRMLDWARRGWIGVNWHGGGNGIYSPIVGAPSTGFTRRPLYYGTQFGQMLAGAEFLQAPTAPDDPRLRYYALRKGRRDLIALINMRDTPAQAVLPAMPTPEVTILTGPTAPAKDATSLTTVSRRPSRTVTVPPVTAMLFTMADRRG